MLDRTNLNDCQPEHIDERFTDTKEHKLAMTLHALRSAVSTLEEMTHDPEYRDLMVEDIGSVSEIALAFGCIWDRIKAREAA